MIACEGRPGYPPDGTVRAVGRRSAAAGCHPSALGHLPADGAPLRVDRVGELRLLRWYWGAEARVGTAWTDTVEAPRLRVHPRRPALAGYGGGNVAQLVHQLHNWTFADRLRPPNCKELLDLGRPR
jgi:hypothetical protein